MRGWDLHWVFPTIFTFDVPKNLLSDYLQASVFAKEKRLESAGVLNVSTGDDASVSVLGEDMADAKRPPDELPVPFLTCVFENDVLGSDKGFLLVHADSFFDSGSVLCCS